MTLFVIAVLLAVAIYGPTLKYGLVGYDDAWLVQDNTVLQHPSWASLRIIFGELDVARRLTLAPEYLPVRDLSIMLDFAIWGDWYPGFHLTNLLLYVVALAAWWKTFEGFGVRRTVAALALLLWAVHPAHAESVAWLAERKGLLAIAFAGLAGVAYTRFRTGRSIAWCVIAMLAAVAAVWSKAHAAFAIAGLGALELLLPTAAPRRRTFIGLAAIAICTLAAFVPVLMLAKSSGVIGTGSHGNRFALALGTHGFYLRLAALLGRNSVSYPLTTDGPTVLDITLGAVGLLVTIGCVFYSARWRHAPAREVRAGAALWLLGWLPVSHLVLPLQMVLVADRYLLLPSLGVALCVAAGLSRITPTRARVALGAVLVLAASIRALDARTSWASPTALWERAVATNPADGEAWSMYAQGLIDAQDPARAYEIVSEGLKHSRSPRLLMRKALLLLDHGDRAEGVALMRQAAEGGEFRAMTNLALLLLDAGQIDEALAWARRGATGAPLYANGQRALGKVALQAQRLDEALTAFERAYTLEPGSLSNRFNLALALIALGRPEDAREHLEACLADPVLGPRARQLLAR